MNKIVWVQFPIQNYSPIFHYWIVLSPNCIPLMYNSANLNFIYLKLYFWADLAPSRIPGWQSQLEKWYTWKCIFKCNIIVRHFVNIIPVTLSNFSALALLKFDRKKILRKFENSKVTFFTSFLFFGLDKIKFQPCETMDLHYKTFYVSNSCRIVIS